MEINLLRSPASYFSFIRIITFFFTLSSFGTSSFSYAADESEVNPISRNEEYLQIYEQIKNQDQNIDARALDEYKIILVPGLWTNSYPKIPDFLRNRGLPIPKELLVSFAGQLQWAKERGIDMEISNIDTSLDCDINAESLASAISTSPKKIILLTHSKGGIDVLHTLIRFPHVQAKVAGWVSMQTPFLGTPLLSWLKTHPWIGSIPRGVLYWFFGSTMESMECLTPDYRQRYYDENREEISNLINEIKFVSFTSSKEAAPLGSEQGVFDTFIRWMSHPPSAIKSDGLVPTPSGCLPGGSCVTLENMDHAAPVMDIPRFVSMGIEKRLLFTRTLFQMLLSEKN